MAENRCGPRERLGHQFFQIAITQRNEQVPGDAKHNDLVLKVPPLEHNPGRLVFTILPYQDDLARDLQDIHLLPGNPD